MVTKQLALDEVLRDGGAVDGHEWLARAIRTLVHQPGDHLLATAGFPLDEHGQLVLRRLMDLLTQPADHRRLPYQLISQQLLVLPLDLPLPFYLAKGVSQHALIPAAAPQIPDEGKLIAKHLGELGQLGAICPLLQLLCAVHHGQHGERLAAAVQQGEGVQAALLSEVGEQGAKLLVLDASPSVQGVPGAGLGLVQHIGKGVGEIIHRQGEAHSLPLDPTAARQLATAHLQHAEQHAFWLEAGVQHL